MRHIRILGLCLAAVFAMTATTLVIASPAFAKCDEECKNEKKHEKEEAKRQKELEKLDKKEEKTHPWQKFFGVCPATGSRYEPFPGTSTGAFTAQRRLNRTSKLAR